MRVTVTKVSAGLAVVIPWATARAMGLIEGTQLEVCTTPAGITLTKPGRRPRRPISQIVAQLDPATYRQHTREFSADRAVGKEIG